MAGVLSVKTAVSWLRCPSRTIGPGPTTGVIKPMLAPAQDETGAIDTELLSRQVGLAQRLVQEKPDSAVAVLRQMLKEPTEEGAQ